MTLNYFNSFIFGKSMNKVEVDCDLAVLKSFNNALGEIGGSRCSLSWLQPNGDKGVTPIYYWTIDDTEPEGIDNAFKCPIEAIVSLVAHLETYLLAQQCDSLSDDELYSDGNHQLSYDE